MSEEDVAQNARRRSPPKLPPLHEVLGDVLDQSPTPTAQAPQRRFPSPNTGYQQPNRYSPTRSNTPSSSYPSPASYTPPHQAPPHSFHLFVSAPSGELVHQRSSARDDLDPSAPKPRLPPQDPARKYACPECGNRFSKQSTLRNHMLTHTGERPFQCQHPGCGRRFSMACNMQRHMRTHTSASAFEIETDDYSQATSRGTNSREGSLSRVASPAEWTTSHSAPYSSQTRQH